MGRYSASPWYPSIKKTEVGELRPGGQACWQMDYIMKPGLKK